MQQSIIPPMPAIQQQNYLTPKVTLRFNHNPLLASRTFLRSKFRYTKRLTNSVKPVASQAKGQRSQSLVCVQMKQQAVSLVRLGEWLRVTTQNHGLGKNVFDLAIVTLKKASSKLTPTFALAAAAFSLAAKLQSTGYYICFKKLPQLYTHRYPQLSLSDIIKYEQWILKALDFCVPVQNSKLSLLLQICGQWNLYLRRNSQFLKMPLRFFQVGTKQGYQTGNLRSVCYLLDLITLTIGNLDIDPELYTIAAVVAVGALNCCQIEQLANPTYILVKFAKGFLRKRYSQVRQPEMLFRILREIYESRVWQKVSLVPPQALKEGSQEEGGWKWFEELQFIPFEEQIHGG